MQIKTNLEIYAISPTLLSLFVALEMKNSKFYMEVGSPDILFFHERYWGGKSRAKTRADKDKNRGYVDQTVSILIVTHRLNT